MAKIAVIRPGAIGDILMVLNFVQELKKNNDVTFFCAKSIHSIISNFIKTNSLCHLQTLEEHQDKNFDVNIRPIGYPLNEGYPFKKMSKHLLEYFAKELNVAFSFDKFIIDLPKFPKKIKNKNSPFYITFQNKTGWSIYKEWWGWQDLINILKDKRPDIEIYQIGGPEDPKVDNIDGTFCGDSFEDNISAQAWSIMHIGLDSVFNHSSNITWRTKGKTKSVILFGSTQAEASGYPHNINISLNLSCQPCFKEDPKLSRFPLGLCNNPPNQTYHEPKHSCMKNISPNLVFENIKKLLSENK